ncbi:aldehyde dehydrogenase (NADP(+)) [Rubritalea tangerina]|uniref:Aldehyde dehydrogenase (NADP(+)) n=1 Tax=Rubritalea tangerina TaxID=430798 RepID=A0ABW4Z9R7_9BACT
MSLTGLSFIGYQRGRGENVCGTAINPATGESIGPETIAATDTELESALELAEQAYAEYREKSGEQRAQFLRVIAANIEAVVDTIAERGPLETGLPEMRMRGESGRTIGQLRLFADLIEEGSWVDARIEHAQAERQPLPKVDLRSMLRPLGPVAVFAASNFPLAFSVAGGDTASALAAGCPVIVKAHASHPGLSEIVAEAVVEAAQATGMPEGVFSMLFGSGRTLGQALVKAEQIKAVGFTGSQAGGRALMDIAAARPEPIPVYAEMSAINPVIFDESALGDQSGKMAEALYGSLTMGVGQFCTNPGLVFIPKVGSESFVGALESLVQSGSSGTMLNAGICNAYREGISMLGQHAAVETVAQLSSDGQGQAGPAVFQTTAEAFLSDAALSGEVFGPATLLVQYEDGAQLQELCERLEGQLTASLFASEEALTGYAGLFQLLEQKAGRLIFNGFPTGVEVCHSMVHGGPYPATSDGRSTSVGSMAIYRFARAVSYQSFPDSALPAELQDSNPLGITRMVDGVRG